jgi:hypothetical protein
MKSDYPQANARLAEMAKNWADGEVSHETWRKERHNIIKSLLTSGKDWVAGEALAIPKRVVSASRATLPIMPALPQSVLMGATIAPQQTEVSKEEVLLLAVLLATMLITSMLLLYIV